jgi:hypothetical protein
MTIPSFVSTILFKAPLVGAEKAKKSVKEMAKKTGEK